MVFKRVLLRFLLLYTYLIVFAAIMLAVEKTSSDKAERHRQQQKDLALKQMWTDMKTKYNMTRSEFDNFTRIAYESLQPGNLKLTGYGTAVGLSLSLCTTIGM